MKKDDRRPYLCEMFSDDYFRTINQTGVRQRLDPCDLGYRGCWDCRVAPDGMLYFSPTDTRRGGHHTRLLAYDYRRDEARICFKAEEVVPFPPRTFPLSKTHESINFLPDGRIFCSTHSTEAPAHHPEWMPFGHYSDLWEGWPGSSMICYHPVTGQAENWGIPVPRESIYGVCYDARHHALYMIGFMRGHIYRLDVQTRALRDLGKAAEIFCYRLHAGPDGHIYGCTKTGYLFRINVDLQVIEDLNWRVPEYPDNYVNNTWYRYMTMAHNVDEKTMIFSTFAADEFFVLDTRTLKVASLGYKTPFTALVPSRPTTLAVNEFAVDASGVLWYPVTVYSFQRGTEDWRRYGLPDYLMRWDYLHGREPECLGVIGTAAHAHGQTSAACLHPGEDVLHLIEGGSNPAGLSLISINLAQFRPHMHQPGGACADPFLHPREMTVEEKEHIVARGTAIEEVTVWNPYNAFPIEAVTPVRLWRSVPHTAIEDSQVVGLVWDENDVLHGICGRDSRYCFQITAAGEVREFMSWESAAEAYRAWLLQNVFPRACEVSAALPLPAVAGRQYRAVATASCEWNGGRTAVGTRDGLLAIISGDGVFALGPAAASGPVRCLYANAARTRLWGTAGDDEDLGTVFTYDDRTGLRQLGFLIYNLHGFFDGPSASNVLSSLAVNPDETMIAIGGADRLGAIHLARLTG